MEKFVGIFCFILLGVNAAVVKRQTNPKESGYLPVTTMCLEGSGDNYVQQTCPASESMCMTQVILDNGDTTIEKSCQKSDACTALEGNNIFQCRGFDAFISDFSVCTFCCVGDLCNNIRELSRLESLYDVLDKISIKPVA